MKTTRRLCKGEFVVEYVGELITEKQGVEREESYPEENASFIFHFKHCGKSWCVDATEESGRLGRLINHSKANVEWEPSYPEEKGSFTFYVSHKRTQVNIQDFLQVFQGSGIGKTEDNLTSADPLSYTTNGSRGDLQILG